MDDNEFLRRVSTIRAELVHLWQPLPYLPGAPPDRRQEREDLQQATDALKRVLNSIARRNGWPECG
jgi:hypothetical protein